MSSELKKTLTVPINSGQYIDCKKHFHEIKYTSNVYDTLL